MSLPPFLPALDPRVQADVAAIARIGAVQSVLRVLLQLTGMRLAVVARVTDASWTCCAVLDETNFGLRPGDTLELATTFCNVVRCSESPLLVNRASEDPRFASHPAPKLYGIESYIAVPLSRRDGTPFGVMCALDPLPAAVQEDRLVVFRHLADLVGYQLEQEEQLDARAAQLLGAQETAQLREQLIGIVSHDLRSPLTAITLSAATMMRRTDLDGRAREGLTRILQASGRANRLIRDLLDFTQARIGKGLPVRRQAMDVNELTQQVVDELQLSVPERLLLLRCSGDGTGTWDPDRVAQVLTNLITNAVQYGPPGEPIRVDVQGRPDAVHLSVHNGGPPIAGHVLASLFQPFTRGEQPGGERRSIGLGLFIVDQILRAHGGSVEVQSTAGAGTAFHVHLPRTA
ncbi:GAF domain-containing sensor histidine kinase [Stigmatella hybrida]|uniref:GAF domain-containing sensor histidine kinase n=1 Tax=Stigmatella hybrida TaxID=394097 RepID=UPI001CDA7A2E|nr:GAF domain-containing sensor histidine kinase [Stigmatella hybrida]